MPRKAINYDKTHFYKIVCRDTSIKDCYVGHTTDFTTRKHNHKKTCSNQNNRDYNCPVYQFIRQNGGWDNWDMILIDTLSCENNLEARRREREYIEKLNATLNRVIPTRSQSEYRADNEELIREIKKHNREKNKDKIKEYQKTYNQENKDKISQKIKDRRKNNLETIREYEKQAYQRNKATRQRPYHCECGKVVSFNSRLDHFKSKKHQQYILNQSNPQEPEN